MSPTGDRIEDKVIVSNLNSCSPNKSSIGTPIKKLIAHETSRETASNHGSPSLVAKLMGLDPIPRQEPDSVLLQKSYSRHCHSGIPSSYWQQDDEMEMQMRTSLEHREYKDVFEVFHSSENPDDKKMALVREKFIKAKRLATDEKLRQSKRFQDALDISSSNRDLLLKFLQAPISLITRHQFDPISVPPYETKRITVLKPSKLVESNKFFGSHKKEKQTKRASDVGQKAGYVNRNLGVSQPNWRLVDDPTQPTRIVVLKPRKSKLEDIKAVVSPPIFSPRYLQSDDVLGEPEDDDAEKSVEATHYQKDNSLLSSVFSNGYFGDESSFPKSEGEYVLGNLSDSELVSPTSRHSWNYIHSVGSPFSSSSFDRASCSPESSACREAKKRLSERWTTMASNGSYVEQPKHVRRSSSTLGDMLRIYDSRSSVKCKEGTSREHEARGSTSCLINDLNRDENVDSSSTNLLRSKSVPVSSTMFGDTLNLKASVSEIGKTSTRKEVEESKSIKTSLKGKVSSFFSRSKRSNKEKASPSQSNDKLDRSCRSTSDSATLRVETKTKEGYNHTIQSSSNTAPTQDSNGVEEKHRKVFNEEHIYSVIL